MDYKTIALAGLIAICLTAHTDPIKSEGEIPKQNNLIFGGKDVISIDHRVGIFRGGDSVDDIARQRVIENQRQLEVSSQRNVLGRGGRVQRVESPGLRYDSKAEKLYQDKTRNCVLFATSYTGIHKSIGYAGTAKVEGQTPQVGSIALEVSYGHAMVVQEVREDGIVIIESNFVRGWITRRFIPYWDVKGYIYAS